MKFNRKMILLLLICSLPVSAMAAEPASTAGAKTVVQEQPAKAEAKPDSSTPAKSSIATQKIRLGYVDMAKIGSDSDLGKKYRSEAQQKQQKFQEQIENRRKQLDKQKKAIEAKIASLTPAQREAKGKEFQKKVEEFQKFGLNAEKELIAFQDQLSKTMLEEVEKAAAAYGKSDALALVIIKQEMLYLSAEVDTIDVTDRILKIMNEKEKKK